MILLIELKTYIMKLKLKPLNTKNMKYTQTGKLFAGKLLILILILSPFTYLSAQISQTAHFPNKEGKADITPELLYNFYLNGETHAAITGFPVKIHSADNKMKEIAGVGDIMDAFCFTEDQCGLKIKVLELQPGATPNDVHTIVLSWWSFGWMQAVDKQDLSGPMGGHESIIVLTYRKTKDGAQIELTQVNVPDYKVTINSPDGSSETGPLSRIVNSHWSTLYWDKYRKHLEDTSR